jgi:hypothetical protein
MSPIRSLCTALYKSRYVTNCALCLLDCALPHTAQLYWHYVSADLIVCLWVTGYLNQWLFDTDRRKVRWNTKRWWGGGGVAHSLCGSIRQLCKCFSLIGQSSTKKALARTGHRTIKINSTKTNSWIGLTWLGANCCVCFRYLEVVTLYFAEQVAWRKNVIRHFSGGTKRTETAEKFEMGRR